MRESEPNPPIAATRPHAVVSPNGVRDDPYYWLRDDARSNPEVLAYLKAENAYRERSMLHAKPLEDALYDEIIARLKQDDSTVPYRKDGYWYSTRFEPGKEHPIFVRRKGALDAAEEILLDANLHAAGHAYYRIGAMDISPDTNWLAYCEDTTGRRQFTLKFKNLLDGEIQQVAIPDVEADLAWANDNRTLLYVEKDPETLLGIYVKKHVLGEDPKHDVLVFEQTDKSFYTGVSKSKSDAFIFLHMESTLSSEWRFARADDPQLRFEVFLPHEADHEYDIEHLGDAFIVRSNWRALNFRLARAPIGAHSDRGAWVDVIAHRDAAYIEEFDVFQEFLAVSVRSEGLRKICIHRLGDGTEFFIASDEAAYTTSISVNPELNTEIVRYAYSSLTTPATLYDYNVRTGEQALLKRDPVLGSFDPADYATEFLQAPARDGASIPVSLVYRKGFVRHGAAPLLQYGYGAYGLSMDPSFSSARLSLLDRGFVYAIAHVRGGQELGRAWYDAGRKLQKKNSFNDFLEVTRMLVERGYAAKDKVFAMGGSAGGLLMGAVANMSDGDYRGIVAQVPFVDVVTTMLDESIPLTTNEYDEWGDPNEAAYYDYMLSYSPYDNVSRRNYPAIYVTTGLWDSQVQYYEPAKWVAKLRALKSDRNRLLMHVEMDAGHGGKSGRFQRYREIAMEYAFLLDELSDPTRSTDA
ncbi:MAG TPA: S9 family peptidase [Steroidobacteraceae bacterium]|jgi:oligopeptidase B|nr:S9 family peptidase [Steroidobacteraceae bacterium]